MFLSFQTHAVAAIKIMKEERYRVSALDGWTDDGGIVWGLVDGGA